MTQSRMDICSEFGRALAVRDQGSSAPATVRSITSAAFSLGDALTVNSPEKTKNATEVRLAKQVIRTFDKMATQLGLPTFSDRHDAEEGERKQKFGEAWGID